MMTKTWQIDNFSLFLKFKIDCIRESLIFIQTFSIPKFVYLAWVGGDTQWRIAIHSLISDSFSKFSTPNSCFMSFRNSPYTALMLNDLGFPHIEIHRSHFALNFPLSLSYWAKSFHSQHPIKIGILEYCRL